MPSTLSCWEYEEGFNCRLITDGKKVGEWTVVGVEVISEEGREIDTDLETNTKNLIASTGDYFVCEEKELKLRCVGSLEFKAIAKRIPEERPWWERVFGGREEE